MNKDRAFSFVLTVLLGASALINIRQKVAYDGLLTVAYPVLHRGDAVPPIHVKTLELQPKIVKYADVSVWSGPRF